MAAKRRIETSKSSSRLESAPNSQHGTSDEIYRQCSYGVVRVIVHRLKYSRTISSREANRMGIFQYPGDSKRPSNRLSILIISRTSSSDFVGKVGVVDLVNILYFCFASTYLYRKSRSIQATANATVSKLPLILDLLLQLQHYLVHMHMPSESMGDTLLLSFRQICGKPPDIIPLNNGSSPSTTYR